MRAPDTILAANALYEAGYPVTVYGLDRILDRIEGNDFLSVVSFRTYRLFTESIVLPNGDAGLAVAAKTKWDFATYRMAKNP